MSRGPLLLAAVLLLPVGARANPDAAVPPSPLHIDEMAQEISVKNIEATVRKLAGFGTRHTLSDTTSDEHGIGAARRWIQGELERYAREGGGHMKVEVDEFLAPTGPRIPQPTPVVNLVATVPGTQPEARDRLYVLSAHYDSRASDVMDASSPAPGADDDASGVAAVLEVARVMAKHPCEATLVFLFVAGEEQGLLGSTHWASAAAARKAQVAAMVTDDIVGNTRDESGHEDHGAVRLFAEGVPPKKELPADVQERVRFGGENDSPPRELARAMKEAGEKYVSGLTVNIIYRRDRYLRSGDQAPFLDRGYAAVRVTEPVEDYRHQHQNVRTVDGVPYGDVVEGVDFPYIAQIARLNLSTLASLALAPAAPTGAQLETARLENDTGLRWQANREPDLGGYRIVWRDTTSPVWQNHVDLAKVTRFVVKGVSKDDVIFGVQAVDRDGNTSPATYALPSSEPPPGGPELANTAKPGARNP